MKIAKLTGLLVATLAVASFAISYNALQSLAVETGVATGWLSYVWPLIIDGPLIVFSTVALFASMEKENKLPHLVLVAVFTAISVVLNVIHASPDFTARAMSAISPIALFFSVEAFLWLVEHSATKQGMRETREALQQEIANTATHLEEERQRFEEERQRLQSELEALQTKQQNVVSSLSDLEEKKKTLRCDIAKIKQAAKPDATPDAKEEATKKTKTKAQRHNRIVALLSQTPGLTCTALAEQCGVATSTISRDLSELKDQNILYENGEGIEPVISTIVHTV